MKKVAGRLKLDQAQFRALEAFAKLGSDLDAATKLTIERGKKNQEILKQAQYAPLEVGKQIAIIYISTQGLLDKIDIKDVKSFEDEFVGALDEHTSTLKALNAGKWDDTLADALKEVAKAIAIKFESKDA